MQNSPKAAESRDQTDDTMEKREGDSNKVREKLKKREDPQIDSDSSDDKRPKRRGFRKNKRNPKKFQEDNLSSDEFFVDKIIGKKIEDEEVKYFVKWDGYGTDEATWEPIENLSTANLAIEKYEKALLVKEQRKIAKRSGKDPSPYSLNDQRSEESSRRSHKATSPQLAYYNRGNSKESQQSNITKLNSTYDHSHVLNSDSKDLIDSKYGKSNTNGPLGRNVEGKQGVDFNSQNLANGIPLYLSKGAENSYREQSAGDTSNNNGNSNTNGGNNNNGNNSNNNNSNNYNSSGSNNYNNLSNGNGDDSNNNNNNYNNSNNHNNSNSSTNSDSKVQKQKNDGANSKDVNQDGADASSIRTSGSNSYLYNKGGKDRGYGDNGSLNDRKRDSRTLKEKLLGSKGILMDGLDAKLDMSLFENDDSMVYLNRKRQKKESDDLNVRNAQDLGVDMDDLPAFGHFLWDKAERISAIEYNAKSNDLDVYIHWDLRLNGVKPQPTKLSRTDVLRYDPQLLVSYYEKGLSLKNAGNVNFQNLIKADTTVQKK